MRRTFSLLLILMIMQSCSSEKVKKVLIVGIDGARPDAILEAETPVIDSLMLNGAYSFSAKTDTISSSGICWTGMLTGVWNNKHKVVSNAYKNPNTEAYPHFFQRLKEYNQKLKTLFSKMQKAKEADRTLFGVIVVSSAVTESNEQFRRQERSRPA